MNNHRLDCYSRNEIAPARGSVREVGVGLGLNLGFYRRAVDRVYGIDLSRELLCLAHERTLWSAVPGIRRSLVYHRHGASDRRRLYRTIAAANRWIVDVIRSHPIVTEDEHESQVD